jgi:hypothetical protein
VELVDKILIGFWILLGFGRFISAGVEQIHKHRVEKPCQHCTKLTERRTAGTEFECCNTPGPCCENCYARHTEEAEAAERLAYEAAREAEVANEPDILCLRDTLHGVMARSTTPTKTSFTSGVVRVVRCSYSVMSRFQTTQPALISWLTQLGLSELQWVGNRGGNAKCSLHP